MSNSAIPWTAACQASCPAQLPRVGSNSCSLITTSFCAALFSFRIFYLLNISIRIFSSVLALHIRWSKYWSFSISPSNKYSRLISFRINWFDLLAVQGTLKRLLQYHSSKASILHHSALWSNSHIHIYNSWKNHSFD